MCKFNMFITAVCVLFLIKFSYFADLAFGFVHKRSGNEITQNGDGGHYNLNTWRINLPRSRPARAVSDSRAIKQIWRPSQSLPCSKVLWGLLFHLPEKRSAFSLIEVSEREITMWELWSYMFNSTKNAWSGREFNLMQTFFIQNGLRWKWHPYRNAG